MKRLRRPDIIFLSLVVIAHIIFFLLALRFKRIYMGDSYEYVYMALNIKDRFLFYAGDPALPILVRNYTLRPPGYSLFLLLVYLFTVNNWVVVVLQNLISIWNVFYLRRTLALLGFEKQYDWVLIVLVLAWPAQFIYADTIAPDILLQTCVLVYSRHFILLTRERKARHAWIMSAALTYGFFTKPILYLFVPLHLMVLAWYCYRFRARWTPMLAVLLPVACILSYNTWNLQRTGKFHFTSIQPHNAMFYNVRMYEEQKLGMERAGAYMRQEKAVMDGQPGFPEWYDYGNERALAFLKAHFVSYMIFHLKYTFQFFIHPGKGEIDLFTGELTYGRFYQKKDKRIMEVLHQMPVSAWPGYFSDHLSVPAMFVILFFNFLKVIGAIAFAFNSRIKGYYRFFAFLLLAYFAFMTGPLANTRYHLPVSLLFIGCAVLGFQGLLQRKKNRSIITS